MHFIISLESFGDNPNVVPVLGVSYRSWNYDSLEWCWQPFKSEAYPHTPEQLKGVFESYSEHLKPGERLILTCVD